MSDPAARQRRLRKRARSARPTPFPLSLQGIDLPPGTGLPLTCDTQLSLRIAARETAYPKPPPLKASGPPTIQVQALFLQGSRSPPSGSQLPPFKASKASPSKAPKALPSKALRLPLPCGRGVRRVHMMGIEAVSLQGTKLLPRRVRGVSLQGIQGALP